VRLELLATSAPGQARKVAQRDDLVRLFGAGTEGTTDDGQQQITISRGPDSVRLAWRVRNESADIGTVAISASNAAGWQGQAMFDLLREFDYVAAWPGGTHLLVGGADVPIREEQRSWPLIVVREPDDIIRALEQTPLYVVMMANR